MPLIESLIHLINRFYCWLAVARILFLLVCGTDLLLVSSNRALAPLHTTSISASVDDIETSTKRIEHVEQLNF